MEIVVQILKKIKLPKQEVLNRIECLSDALLKKPRCSNGLVKAQSALRIACRFYYFCTIWSQLALTSGDKPAC